MSRDPSVFTLVDIRLKMPPLGGGSIGIERSLAMLCGNELVLVLREMMGSGSCSIDGRAEDASESLPRIGSGEGCMELMVVGTADSGDMVGDLCCGLEAIDEVVMAEVGALEVWVCCRRLAVWTLLGRGRRGCEGWEDRESGRCSWERTGEQVSCGGGVVELLADDMVVDVG